MLAYLLALVVAVGSLVFYLAAFFLPEIHRRQDFVWSGVGLFYALVLWSCAGRITGAVLLGQIASVALLGGLAWQTLALRREITPVAVRTAATWQAAQQWLDDTWHKLQGYFQRGSLTAAWGAIAQDMQQASGTLRQRIAGPRGQTVPADSNIDRTPLRGAAMGPPTPVTSTSSQKATEAPLAPTLPWGNGLKVLLAKLATLTNWGGGQLSRFRKPKPKRAVIDIPPRAPSIPRSPSPSPAGSAEPVANSGLDDSPDHSAPDHGDAGMTDGGAAIADADQSWVQDLQIEAETQSEGGGEHLDATADSAAKGGGSEDAGAGPTRMPEPPSEVTNWDD